MLKNTKLLGTVLLLTVACGKSDNNKPNGLGGVEITIDNPLPVNDNLVIDKETVDNAHSGADYSKNCSDEGVSCDGVWMLKQARCNDVPISGSFEGEAVVMNIKGSKSELQLDSEVILNAEFSLDEVRSDVLVFKVNDETTLKKSYTIAFNEGIMNVYLPGNDAKCASGDRKMIFTRLDSQTTLNIFTKAADIALAKQAAELAPQPQVVEGEVELPAGEAKTEVELPAQEAKAEDSVSIVVE